MKTSRTTTAKKVIKKEALFEAAYGLFTQQGVAGTSISDITTRAGIAKGTFYLYFQNKEDLRDQLAFRKALITILQCLDQAAEAGPLGSSDSPADFENQAVYMAGILADYLVRDPDLLSFTTENMGWNFLMQDMQTQRDEYAGYFQMIRSSLAEAGRYYQDPYGILCICIGLVANILYSRLILNHEENIGSLMAPISEAVRGVIRSQRIPD